MAVNDNFEVKITATFQGDVAMNVLHYQQTAGAGGITAVIGSLIDGILADFVPKMQACMTSYVQFQSVRVQQVGVVAPSIEKRGTILEGLVSDVNPLPGQDAVLFVKRCNTGG